MPIFFLLSRINKHMTKRRQQSILAGERKFFRKGAWKLWAREIYENEEVEFILNLFQTHRRNAALLFEQDWGPMLL